MTAICGSWHWDGHPGAAEDCSRMQSALSIYGRDRSARRDMGEIAFGLQLWRLVPEDRFDRQPLVGGGGRFTLVADGRIDNRPELAEALGLPADRTASMADADFILAAWERWGEDCLDRLYGDYAFALWDSTERVLRLVRDPLGKRPLFVHRSPGHVAFATMAKGLHALPHIPRAPDPEMIRDFLALLPHVGPRSFFAGIERVEPGQMLRLLPDGRAERVDWYDRTAVRAPTFARPEAYVEAFRSLFDRAVSDCLRTTSPQVASHLSGGMDSGTVTATAAGLLAARGQRLTAFTHVPLPGAPLMRQARRYGNEGPMAATLAARYANIDHVLVDCAKRQIGDDFDSNFHYFEYPLLNPANSQWGSEIDRLAAARGARLVLNGQFGNATLSCTAYERLAELLGRGRLLAWLRNAIPLARSSQMRAVSVLWRSVGPFVPTPLLSAIRRLGNAYDWSLEGYSALKPAVIQSEAMQARLAEVGMDGRYAPYADARSPRIFMLWRTDYLAQHHKGILASTGVDSRDPTHDRRFVEFSLGLPSEMFLRDGQCRWIFQQAFADRLSPEIMNQRGKGLQAADWATRLRADLPALRSEIERAGHSSTADALMDLPGLLALAAEGPRSNGEDLDEDMAYRCRFLRGLAMAHFLRKLEAGNY